MRVSGVQVNTDNVDGTMNTDNGITIAGRRISRKHKQQTKSRRDQTTVKAHEHEEVNTLGPRHKTRYKYPVNTITRED